MYALYVSLSLTQLASFAQNGWITSSSQKLPPTTYNTTSGGASFSLGLGARNGFTEVVRRNSGRYEMRYGTSSPPFTDNVVRENKTLHDCLKKIFKEEYYLLGCSVVISTKDSKEQQWHVDGGHVDSKEVRLWGGGRRVSAFDRNA